jgi:hypothetical protein
VLEHRKILWAEVLRRFSPDVERACRIARAADPAALAGTILAQALRSVGSEPVRSFSRDLVTIMKRHLGEPAVLKVRRSLYLRQFLSELPPESLPYAEGLLNHEGRVERLAQALGQDVETVRQRSRAAWSRLAPAVEKEYDDEEVQDRTDGVWRIPEMKGSGAS